MQNGQFRACCRSRFVIQFRKQFAFQHLPRRICLHQIQLQSHMANQLQTLERGKLKKIKKKKEKKNDTQDSDDRLRDLSEWLEEFTDNLEDSEIPVSAHIFSGPRFETSCESWHQHQRSTVFILTSPKDQNSKECLRTTMTTAPLQKTHWRSGSALIFKGA